MKANLNTAKLYLGDVLECLKKLPDNSVHTVVTSPPYWGLRVYATGKWSGGDPKCRHDGCENICAVCGATKTDAQIGQEDSPEQYIEALTVVFREIRRVLHPSGILAINIGDAYSGSGKGPTGHNGIGDQEKRQGFVDARKPQTGCKPKDLIGLPWMLAFALRNDGWWLRSKIPWVRRSGMPESCTDRPSSAVEEIFLLAKNSEYFWDSEAIKMPLAMSSVGRIAQDVENQAGTDRANGGRKTNGPMKAVGVSSGRNRRNSDWFFETWQGLMLDEEGDPLALVVNPQPYRGAHFATFAPRLVDPFVKAGTSERGVCTKCLEPFRRVMIRTKEIDPSAKGSTFDGGKTGARDGGERTQPGDRYLKKFLGWRPNCSCYGHPIIDDPPTPPTRKRQEIELAYEGRLQDHKSAMGEWMAAWDNLRPIYDDLPTQPATVMDCFNGSGTSGVVSLQLGRNYIGIDLSEAYIELARKRLEKETDPLFSQVTVMPS